MIIITAIVIALLILAVLYYLLMSPNSQSFGDYPYRAVTNELVVALTFDDGPNEPYTSQIVDYLTSKNIRATFFQVGACVEKFPSVSRNIAESNHVIANHSTSHKFYKYFTQPSFAKEIAQNQIIIQERTGKTPALYRSPWLMRHPWLFRTVRKKGLQPVAGIFCHPLEPWQPSAARIAKSAIRKTKPGVILIFHDGREGRGGDRTQTVEAVKITVEALLDKGYRFVTVDELLGIPAYS